MSEERNESRPAPAPIIPCVRFKLGRKAVKRDSRTLHLGAYLKALSVPPPAADWTRNITDWGMMLNDKLGDCTIAGCGHALQTWSMNAQKQEVTVSDKDIEAAYKRWCGYNPHNPLTDQGGIELDVLTDWRKNGLAGHTLWAFADAHSVLEAKQGISLFGGVYIGVALPISAQDQDVWDVVKDPGDGSTEPGSWGGHCVFVPKYDANGFTCITWGALKSMTRAFWEKYVDEVHVLLGADWMGPDGLAPAGFNVEQLRADLAEVTR